jgi:UDP:flavonoid glycosyltransferase YjiC (YdhE family)
MRLLFASMPFDGHVNPLAGLAVHLAGKGHDVRFYTGPGYAKTLAALGIPHLPFVRASDVNAQNLVERFPEYEKLGTGPRAIEFALTKIFFGNTRAHFQDIRDLRQSFDFDVFVCDAAFYALHLVVAKLAVPSYVIAPSPTPAPTSPTAPPPFFGLRPARTIFGRLQHRVVRALLASSSKTGMRLFDGILAAEGLPPYQRSIFDLPWRSARAVFQTGVPGMDFPREDWPDNFHFVGPLLPPARSGAGLPPAIVEKLGRYRSMIVVSQGTIDNRDPEKLIVPALEALKDGPHLVVACTGHRNTEVLRRRFSHDNVVIEDFVDFEALLARARLFICNGGYGSIMHALVHGVPVLSAGKLEGKNDINGRLEHRGLGVDLRTERPSPAQIARGVARVLADPAAAASLARVRDELASYSPFEIIERTMFAPGNAREGREARSTP